MSQPLEGINVVEFAQGVAGPYAGKLLAGYGADVIKVEPPSGDSTRRVRPFRADSSDQGHSDQDVEDSSLFLHLNTSKRSVIDPRTNGNPTVDLDALLAWADVVVQSEPSPDPIELRRQHPNLVIATVTPFGLTGPYAGFVGEEIIHYAFGGPMSASGAPEREPLMMGGNLGQYQCGTIAAVSILGGLAHRDRHGDGVHIDLSNVDTQVGSIDRRMTYLLYAAYRGGNVDRTGGYRQSALPNGCRPTLDGHVQISTFPNWIPKMLSVIDDPAYAEIFEDPDFIADEDVPEQVDAHVLGWTLTQEKQQAMETAQALGWPVTALNAPVDLLADPHFQEQKFFAPIDHGSGPVLHPGAPVRLKQGWAVSRPAPALGQHTDEIATELKRNGASYPASDLTSPDPSSPSSPSDMSLPLDGLRILDMTVVWAGPYATCILGDLGAEIIRVDNPWLFPSATRGILARPSKELIDDIGGIMGGYPDGEPGDRPWNRVGLFNAHARNKKSVTLNIQEPLGREAFLKLVENCDMLIENNSVDLLSKLGIDWDVVRERNPKFILLRMPSVGLAGPYKNYRGFGVNFEALCGLGSLRGYPDGDPSENESVFHMDAASGSAGAFAALMALRRRDTTGVGELVELSQSENMLNHIGEYLIDAHRTGERHSAIGNRHSSRAPQGCYPCRGEDAWVVISIGTDQQWIDLCQLSGKDWDRDHRFGTVAGRRQHHDEIDELIASWTATLEPAEIFTACQGKSIPAAPVLHELEAMADPHLNERGMFRSNSCPDTGHHTYPGHLWRWDGPDLKWGPLPVLGGDNEDVLHRVAGLSQAEIEKLRQERHLSLDFLDPNGNPV